MTNPFASLPAEIRYQIYHYLLPADLVICFDLDWGKEPNARCQLISCNDTTMACVFKVGTLLKLARVHSAFIEVLALVYGNVHFQFLSLDQALVWLQRIGNGSRAIQRLSIDCRISKWQLDTDRIRHSRLISIFKCIPCISTLTLYLSDIKCYPGSNVDRKTEVFWRAQGVLSHCEGPYFVFTKDTTHHELPAPSYVPEQIKSLLQLQSKRQRHRFVCTKSDKFELEDNETRMDVCGVWLALVHAVKIEKATKRTLRQSTPKKTRRVRKNQK